MSRAALRCLVVLAPAVVGCATNELGRARSRARPADVIIVPGCPTEADGSLSGCLRRRIVWAELLFHEGLAKEIITSGAATYNRYFEAEALAAGLVALGVPPERIWLEPDARHTDENVFYALLLALRLGATSIAVASDGGQAAGGCSFLSGWGQPCLQAGMDTALVSGRLDDPQVRARLDAVKVPPLPEAVWLRVDAFEAERRRRGGPDRPGSIALYWFRAPFGRLFGDPWYPPDPPGREPIGYRACLERLGAAAPCVCRQEPRAAMVCEP
ncbi:MAG: YdcF family protein [Deltaproteobacteria bacterium]|nr:YdcF family protein [Deltaproteobacteria bacterium]